jgi:signal transduction histidine kinase
VPLTTQDGFNIGTLCLIGHQPGSLSESQKEALRILSDEIISRYELKSLKEKMEKRNAEKDELIRIVSHDMRNPLTGIIGFSELMQQETGNDEHREMLEYIETAGESMLNIVNVLLNSEYIRNEAFIINKREANASELTQNVIDLHTPFALMKNLDMDVQMEEDIICNLDAEKWKQIVGNLLNNAIKFSHPDDQIKLSLTTFIKRKPFLLLKITDKGIGISDEMIQNLFSGKDSIRREGTNGEESTGLGMYIVKKYVSLMGGTISISSTQGSGTQVTVQIPV